MRSHLMLEESCSRGSLDEKRQLERHKQTLKQREKPHNKETGKDKSMVRNNRKRQKRKSKTQHKKEDDSC